MNSKKNLVTAVILDWAGTMIDHGCMAPVVALQTVLARHGFTVSAAEARTGMGLAKKDHLRQLLTARQAAAATDAIYPELEQEIFDHLDRHAGLIAGAKEFAGWLRASGLLIGTTTGYTGEMMRIVAAAAARQGYVPDSVVTPDQVSAGRPAPFMIYKNALQLGIWSTSTMVKIGDTPSDIDEGRNAGTWTIGVALTGNALGLTPEETAALPKAERLARFDAARESLLATGADYVVDSIAECPGVIQEINGLLEAGTRPEN